MRAFERLGELAGIADEHDVPRTRGHPDEVTEAHLARLVDHERVDRRAVVPGEPPGGAGDDVRVGWLRRALARAEWHHHRGLERAPVPAAAVLLDPEKRGALGLTKPLEPGEHVVDRRVAVRGHTDGAPVVDQRRDHARERVGLARPGRALDGEPGAIEGAHRTNRGRERGGRILGGCRVDERRAWLSIDESRELPREKRPDMGERLAPVGDVFGHGDHRPLDLVGLERLAGHQRERPRRLAGFRPSLQHEPPGSLVELDDGARARAVAEHDGAARAHLRLLLGEAERVAEAPCLRLSPAGEVRHAPAETVRVLDVELGGGAQTLEVALPLGLRLPTMKAQQIRGEAPGVALRFAGRLELGLAVGGRRRRQGLPVGHILDEPPLERIDPRPLGRLALAPLARLVALLSERVVGGRLARVHVERLELLDRVGHCPDAHALAHDPVQVDEPVVAQKLVDLVLARAVIIASRVSALRSYGA